jgi:hypothetical protein
LSRVDNRPLLKTLWPTLMRGSGQVQFGLDPEQALVVDGLTPAQVAALGRLDGLHVLPDELAGADSAELLALLHAHRLVAAHDPSGGLSPQVRALLAADADAAARSQAGGPGGYAALGRRREAHVLVVGRGSLPAALTSLLRRAGASARCAPQGTAESESAPDGTSPPGQALVVLTGAHALDPALGEPWRARGIPVLPVVLHATEAVIGPVVVPTGPCLRCLDLARTDLDPSWPALLGQLVPATVGAGPEVTGETTLVWLGAAMAAMVALAVIDGARVPVGRSLEAGLPWPRIRQRQWPVHPRCGCGSADASGRPADERGGSQARMAG